MSREKKRKPISEVRAYRRFNLFGLLKTIFFTVPPAISLLVLIVLFIVGTMINPHLLNYVFGPPGS
jgi:hypothetical protein